MKKFRTRKEINTIKIILISSLFIIVFIILSLCKLNNSHTNLTLKLLNSFTTNNTYDLRFLTKNLDELFNSYAFYKKSVSYNENIPFIYLYNSNDKESYDDGLTISEATNFLRNNLSKLGIKVMKDEKKLHELSDLNNFYLINIHRNTKTDKTVKINEKLYAKICFILEQESKNYLKNKEIMTLMNEYLNKNYPNISKGICEREKVINDSYNNNYFDANAITIELGGIKNSTEEINNSTEIISLMLYHMLGD